MIDINQGEIKVKFESPLAGKQTFADLGLKDEDLIVESGNLRLVFDLEGIGDHEYYQVPTIEVAYAENMAETHWICEFNKTTLLDKLDHYGHSTVLLLNRDKMSGLEQHHKNALIVHADFPGPVHIKASESYINFFK